MKKGNTALRHRSHRNEDESKRAFEEVIEPFFVTGWTTKDYGIDGLVEITSHLDSAGHAVLESKCFLVQMKSVEQAKKAGGYISYSIPVDKIISWYDYNLPVLFALYDVGSKIFYYQWVDDLLLAALDKQKSNWKGQKTVAHRIALENVLDQNCHSTLKNYVFTWRRRSRRYLEPGKYFQLKDQAHSQVLSLKEISLKFSFQSIHKAVESIEIALDLALYRVALTGPSRVGKSSLINGLLGKTVSPTGFFQTTGVPIQVIPGSREEITVYYQDKKMDRLPFSLENIGQFASQDNNEDNKKGVRLVSIAVKNEQLERGICLFDIPGLDDPSDEVLSFTWQAVRTANAIIYVIDASPAQDGGYIFRNDYKKHIKEFGRAQDKVFLVFNKVDKLTDEVLGRLKEKVAADIVKHDLVDSVGNRVFFLSATDTRSVEGRDTVAVLNERLWEFILGENKAGLLKLRLINEELRKTLTSFEGLLKARLVDFEKCRQLTATIGFIRQKVPSLESDFRQRQTTIQKLLVDSVDSKSHDILAELEKLLKSFALNQSLPSGKDIRNLLLQKLNKTILEVNHEYLQQVNALKTYIDSWIEDNLQQLKEILHQPRETRHVQFTEIESFEMPQQDYTAAAGMGVIGMVLAYMVAPPYAITAGIVGFLASLFTSAESHRVKHIDKIMERSREKYVKEFSKIKDAYQEAFTQHLHYFVDYINQKLHYYFNDLEAQLAQIDGAGLPGDSRLFEEALEKVTVMRTAFYELDAELQSFDFSN
ncbi:MAG TPA: dynamin family protein [Puia sp.]